MKHAGLAICTALALSTGGARVWAVDKLRIAYVSPSLSLSLPWVAKESGILAKHDLDAEVLLITGSPRLVQSLIAGEVDLAFAGITAITRARLRGADVAIVGASANVSSQKLLISGNSKIRRLEDLKRAVIGVSQYGSEADTLKILSPSGTFAATRALIQRKRGAVERLMRSFVEAMHFLKTNRNGSVALLQKYFGGLSAEETSYLYQEQVDLMEALPAPNDKARQAVLDRETDPKGKSFATADFVDASFFREIDKSGLIEQLYRK